MNRATLLTAVLGGATVVQRINAWQNAQTTLIHAGGRSTITPIGAGLAGNTAAGITLLTAYATSANADKIRQPGYIWGAKINIRQVGVGMSIRFRVFRVNGGNYDMVGQSEAFTPTGTGVQTYTFATPIRCEYEDLCGVFLTGSTTDASRVKIEYATLSNATARYVTGDMTTSDPFTSTAGASTTLGIEFMCHPPYLCATGDSIPEGHHTASRWHGHYDTSANGLTGTKTSEIMNQLRASIGSGTLMEYQNHALGSQTAAWVLSTGIVSAIATGARNILIHVGVNDIAAARNWATFQTDLDAIMVLVNAATPIPRVLIGEVNPWTSASDAQAATTRTFNTNLSAWASANGATLIRSHDEMGQIRAATGQLDDILTAYNQDGIHYTQAGVDKMATIWKRYL